jgi:hypothetical protein
MIDYVITNTSNEVKRIEVRGEAYGINLTVETTMACDSNYSISFKSEGVVYTNPFPAEYFALGSPNPEFKKSIEWCAIEDGTGGCVMGSFFPSSLTRGLWPGEERHNGRDYEIVFRSVTYQPGQEERYHFKICGGPGNIASFARGELSNPTQVERIGADAPVLFQLSQNYPNPFNPTTTIRYQLPQVTQVSLKVYNSLGQEVATLVSELQNPGCYQAQYTPQLPSGICMYRLQAGGYAQTRKLILLR